jgi:hypothetical protein
VAFASSPLRHPQPFFTPKPLNPLVIDNPALTTCIMVSGPEPATRMSLGVGAQPCPQHRIRILRRRRDRFVALGPAMLPGNAAGEPLADPQHLLEMTNRRPPAFRA